MANRKKAPANAEIVEMEKWHVPDWREIDKYPADWRQLTADQKKWEFLRRHIRIMSPNLSGLGYINLTH